MVLSPDYLENDTLVDKRLPGVAMRCNHPSDGFLIVCGVSGGTFVSTGTTLSAQVRDFFYVAAIIASAVRDQQCSLIDILLCLDYAK
jgi:hypothetical protein